MAERHPSEGAPSGGKAPALSLILCSRNDDYMGNSRWRLQTTLNYAASVVGALGREADVEIVVADWGSEVPLSDVLELSARAARMTSFVVVPPDLARRLQGDSPFPEVLALNAAARRARGEYLGRIDQDTLVGTRFVRSFFALFEGRQALSPPMRSALMFSNRRDLPYRFAARCPSAASVEKMVALVGPLLRVRTMPERPFWTYWVGIWLAHRALWQECGGYDETLIYYNWMESDMIARLRRKYEIVDLGKLVGCDFYHFEHYHPRVTGVARNHPRKNPPARLGGGVGELHPNGDDWGLNGIGLEIRRAEARDRTTRESGVPFVVVLLLTASQMLFDAIALAWLGGATRLGRRAALVRETVRAQPLSRWPGLLARLWFDKRAARRQPRTHGGARP